MGLELSAKGEAIVQTISVIKDGEKLFSLTSRNTGPRFWDMICNFEDLFGPGKVNLKDINHEVQKRCLKVKKIKIPNFVLRPLKYILLAY